MTFIRNEIEMSDYGHILDLLCTTDESFEVLQTFKIFQISAAILNFDELKMVFILKTVTDRAISGKFWNYWVLKTAPL